MGQQLSECLGLLTELFSPLLIHSRGRGLWKIPQQPCIQPCARAGDVSRCEYPICNLIIVFHLHTGFSRRKWYGSTVERAPHIQRFSSADVWTPACAAWSMQQGCEHEKPGASRGVWVSNCLSVHQLKTEFQVGDKQKTSENGNALGFWCRL